MVKSFLFLIGLEIFICAPFCQEGLRNCTSCNPITKLCVKCDKDVLVPDEEGGCKNSKKCILGKNNCLECNEDQNLCKTCEDGYFSDENGGCSYTNNCEISYKGKCLKCKDNFIFVGPNTGVQICKSLNSEDLKNCETINIEKGVCEKCKEGFYLNIGDKKCSQTEHCYESSFGVCQKCSSYYYLNKKEEKCIIQTEGFYNCRESLNGEVCNLCHDNYYLSEDGKCCKTNYCSEAGNYWCNKCSEGYYLSEEDQICTSEENCLRGKEDIGVCLECIDGYALDFKDGKCKLNTENEITMKFYDSGTIQILYNYYNYNPSELYVDGVSTSVRKSIYFSSYTSHNITM